MTAPSPSPHEWQSAYAKIQRASDAEILKAIHEGRLALDRQLRELDARAKMLSGGFSSAVRREQLLVVKRSLMREEAKIFRKVGDVIEARRLEAAARSIELAGKLDEKLFQAAGRIDIGKALTTSLTEGLEHTVEVVTARLSGASVPLAQRVYRTEAWMDGRVERMVNNALARGLSAQEFAKEAREFIDPFTPGGTRYASLRLARTEINNSFHAISIQNAVEKPWVEAMKWHLSASHKRPDVCNQIANGGKKGDGVYPPSQVPSKQHPHCFCYVTPIVQGEDEFLDDLIAGKYDGYLAEQIPAYRGTGAPLEKFIGKPAFKKPTAPPKPRAAPPTPKAPTTPKAPPKPKTATPKAAPPKAPAFNEALIDKRLAPKIQEAAMNAGRATEAKIGDEVSRVKSVRQHVHGASPAFDNVFDKGAFAACSQGHIEMDPLVALRRAEMEGANKSKWFIPEGKKLDEFDKVLAHEMGHAISVEYFDFAQSSRLMEEIKYVIGTTHDFGGRMTLFSDNTWKDWLEMGQGRDKVRSKIAAKFGKYATTNLREFIAEVWSVYALDATASPAVASIGKLIEQMVKKEVTR